MGGVAPDALPRRCASSDPVTRRNTHPASRDAAPRATWAGWTPSTRPGCRAASSSPAQSTARPTRRIAARRNLSTTPPPPGRSFAAADPRQEEREIIPPAPPVSADASSGRDDTFKTQPLASDAPDHGLTAPRQEAPGRATRRRDAASGADGRSPLPRRRPRRQLWIVRVPPPPPADADAEAAMEAKEARVLELTATVDRAMATIAERNAARDEARTALAGARCCPPRRRMR